MKRINLIRRGATLVTPDVSTGLDLIEERAKASKFKVSILPSRWDPNLTKREHSLSLAGREVKMSLPHRHLPGNYGPQERLAMMWSFAIPAGFTPWLRHPVPGPGDDVFHFFGPWQSLYDRLCSEGRGELAWPSICAASQVDVGEWKGTMELERFVQAQLHRIGVNAGAINGVILSGILQSIDHLGIRNKTMKEAAKILAQREAPSTARVSGVTRGHIVIPGRETMISAYGAISQSKTSTGYSLNITGPGRVILDIT